MVETSKYFSLITYVTSLAVDLYLLFQVEMTFSAVLIPTKYGVIPAQQLVSITVATVGPLISISPDLVGLALTALDIRLQHKHFSPILSAVAGVAPMWSSAGAAYSVAGMLMIVSLGVRLYSLALWAPSVLGLWTASLAASFVSVAVVISAGLHRHK